MVTVVTMAIVPSSKASAGFKTDHGYSGYIGNKVIVGFKTVLVLTGYSVDGHYSSNNTNVGLQTDLGYTGYSGNGYRGNNKAHVSQVLTTLYMYLKNG